MSTKMKRFRFNHNFDLALIRCVTVSGAHLAKHGEREEKYAGLLAMFLASREFLEKSEEVPPPKVLTIRERIKVLVKERRAVNKRNIAATGIAEEYGELEQLLDGIIDNIDEKAKVVAEEKDAMEKKELALQSAAKTIRDLSLKRNADELSESSDVQVNTPKKKAKKAAKTDVRFEFASADAEMKLIEEEAVSRREQEARRIAIDERRVALEERRIALDEKNAEVQLELRKVEAEEKKSMAAMLAAVLAKLQ
eukprot:IDg22180t1